MALPTQDDLKAVIRYQGSTQEVLDFLDACLERATAMVQAYLRRPIEAEERTFVIEKPPQAVTRAVSKLFVPIYPVAAQSSSVNPLELTDADDVELVEDTDYRLDLRTGEIVALDGGAFTNWPYTIEASVGLSANPEYATEIEPAIGAAILDVAADLYQRRNPGATSESTGGGVSHSYAGGLPERVKETLNPWRLARARA